jgi:GcrA cell cycle regulator
MSWTDERIALLKKMWKEGKSAAEIAKTLGKGVTRNAVIGKAHRMGLSGRPSPIKKPAPAKKEAAPKKPVAAAKPVAAPAAVPAAKGRKKQAAAPQAPAGAVLKSAAAIAREAEELRMLGREIAPLNGGVALIDLTERMCKWPIGDPREADFTFCGRNIRPGTPYCPEHAAMAYQTSSRNRHAAAVAAQIEKDNLEDDEDEEVEVDEEEEEGEEADVG